MSSPVTISAQAQSWRASASCRGLSWLMLDPSRVEQARTVCAVCPVVVECAHFAETHDVFGTMAGRWFDDFASTAARSSR